MKTPTKNTSTRSFKRNTPKKSLSSSDNKAVTTVRCETEILKSNIAVLVFNRESGSPAFAAQLTRHLEASSNDTKEDLKLIDVSTVFDGNGALVSYTNASGKTFNVQGIIIGFDNEDDLFRIIRKICRAYSTVTTPLKNGAPYQAKLGCIKGGLEEDYALRCLSQAVGRYGAAKMVCQMHYESLADGSLLDA